MKDDHGGPYRPNFIMVPDQPLDEPASWGTICALAGIAIAFAILLALALVDRPRFLDIGIGPSLSGFLVASALYVITLLGVLVWRRRRRH
jgi:hypothetical protein